MNVPAIAKGTYLALRDKKSKAPALTSEETIEEISVQDLPQVAIPTGGGTKWIIPHALADDEILDSIEGILVLYQKNGVLWPTEGEAIEGTLPVLITYDLRTAHRVSEDIGDLDPEILSKAENADGTYDWKGTDVGGKLAYNAWRSSAKGKGKRCTERRILGILRPDTLVPLVVSCGPGSLKGVTSWMKGLQMEGVPYYRVVVKLGLRSATNAAGIKYSQLEPSTSAVLSAEEGKLVNERYTKPLTKAMQEWIPRD